VGATRQGWILKRKKLLSSHLRPGAVRMETGPVTKLSIIPATMQDSHDFNRMLKLFNEYEK
jgi:hypothetical protein